MPRHRERPRHPASRLRGWVGVLVVDPPVVHVMIPKDLIAASCMRGRVARGDCIRIHTVESKKQASPGFPAPAAPELSADLCPWRFSPGGFPCWYGHRSGGRVPMRSALGESCVLDPTRPCRACLAPSPRDCPYLYLLYDVRRPFRRRADREPDPRW